MSVEYHPHLITYLDILGFKNIIEKESPEKVKGILDRLRQATEPGKMEKDTHAFSFVNFSDTNIRAIPLDHKSVTDHKSGLLFYEALHIAHIQANLIVTEGVLLRGSMTTGELYMTDSLIFGPALIQAYFLETDISVYPRIIVDPAVIKLYRDSDILRNDIHDYEMDKEYVEQNLRKDLDGIYYIDYLKTMSTEFDEHGYGQFLNDHKEFIESKLPAMNKVNSVGIKYNWLVEYHNSTVQSFGDTVDGWPTEDLLIDPGTVPFRTDL